MRVVMRIVRTVARRLAALSSTLAFRARGRAHRRPPSLSRPPASMQLLRIAIELQPSDVEGYARLAAVLAPPLLGAEALPTADGVHETASLVRRAVSLDRTSELLHGVHAEMGRLNLLLGRLRLRRVFPTGTRTLKGLEPKVCAFSPQGLEPWSFG